MIDNIALTSDHIKQAVTALRSLRPVYRDLLDFYQQIFIAQEDSKSHVQIEPIQIPHDIISVKAKDDFPLINISDFVIDIQASKDLLIQICNIIKKMKGDMAASAQAVLQGIETGKLDPESLFFSLFEGGASFFEKTATRLKIDKSALAFITYNSIKPSLTICAAQLSTYLEKESMWEKGYCPVCGSMPGLSMFMEKGERFLFCSFCWHQWSSQRLHCPFCNNTDSKTLNYFYSEEEKEYRVDLCDSCKKYIKTIDTRETQRYIYPPLEAVSTLHLDIKAQEKGFESGVALDLKI
ncbi:MAG: formate dehydrogenase accessory protein FdhE [Thermodesulfobacteriota bacterium]|nr:formate dehydrogenase accessory protein FdhE [Thermodesulfobacteriota bacterium]